MIEWRMMAMPSLRKELLPVHLCDFQGIAFSSLPDAPAGVRSYQKLNAFETLPASFSIKLPICYQLQSDREANPCVKIFERNVWKSVSQILNALPHFEIIKVVRV